MGRKSHLVPPSFLITLTIITLLFVCHASRPKASLSALLRSHGLPGGLFPRNTKSYDLVGPNLILVVHMEESCLATYDESRVFYDYVVRANLTDFKLIGVEGLVQEDLFLWLPVKDIVAHAPVILFDIGFAVKHFAFSMFDEPRNCVPVDGSSIPVLWRNEVRLSDGTEQDKAPYIMSS